MKHAHSTLALALCAVLSTLAACDGDTPPASMLDVEPRSYMSEPLYFGYTTPSEFMEGTLAGCAHVASGPSAGTYVAYYDDDNNLTHWGLSIVSSVVDGGPHDLAQEQCLRTAVLNMGGSPVWPPQP